MSSAQPVVLGDLADPSSLFETLKAERECWKTYLEYFEVIDQKQAVEKAGLCFTESAEIAYHMKGPSLVFSNRSDYVAFLQAATAAQEMTAHIVGQARFEWHAGKPRLFTYVSSWQWFTMHADRGDTRPAEFVTIGYSEDDFELVDGRWLISRRHVRPAAGLVAVGAPPPPLG